MCSWVWLRAGFYQLAIIKLGRTHEVCRSKSRSRMRQTLKCDHKPTTWPLGLHKVPPWAQKGNDQPILVQVCTPCINNFSLCLFVKDFGQGSDLGPHAHCVKRSKLGCEKNHCGNRTVHIAGSKQCTKQQASEWDLAPFFRVVRRVFRPVCMGPEGRATPGRKRLLLFLPTIASKLGCQGILMCIFTNVDKYQFTQIAFLVVQPWWGRFTGQICAWRCRKNILLDVVQFKERRAFYVGFDPVATGRKDFRWYTRPVNSPLVDSWSRGWGPGQVTQR